MGHPEGRSIAANEGKAPAIKRELSVEDLFAPLNRLDVRHPSSSADASPLLKAKVPVLDDVRPSADTSSNPTHRVSVFETHLAAQQQSSTRSDAALVSTVDRERIQNSNSPVAKLNSCFMLDMAPIPEETGLGFADKLSTRIHGLNADCYSIEGGSATGLTFTREQMHSKSLSTASASDAGLQQGNSSSEEDQQVVDDRKQRRMLSNRESARRSRLRKQQHLDELRGHVAQLRAQNSQMLSSFNLASQQFAQVTEENRQLRSEAMDLSHKLQRLHHTVTSQHANNGLRLAADSRKEAQAHQY